jgi:integrase
MPRKKGRVRTNGQGSISRRNDGRVDVELTVYTLGGPQRLRTTKRNEAEADAWLTEMKHKRNTGFIFNLGAESITFGEYLERWLKDVVEGSVSHHTYRDYKDKVILHLVSALGKVKLKALTALHLQALYRQKTDKGFSPRTVEYIHTTARKALAKAEEWDLVHKNVARYARPPAPEHKEHRTLTVPEAKVFFEAAAGDRLEALYILALTTGLRRGELLGLKWTDLNLDSVSLGVNRSMDTLYGPPEEKGPKRQSSRRTIALVPEAVAALRTHKKHQTEEKLGIGPAWREHDLIFPTRVGTPMRGDNLLKRSLRPLLEKARLPPITFHQLRHTFQLVAGERPKVVQEILSHSSIKTTMDTYSHVIPGMQEAAAKRLQGILFGSTPVTLPSDGDNGAAARDEEQENLPFAGLLGARLGQDSNLRSSDS